MNQPHQNAASGVASQPTRPTSALLPERWFWPVRATLALFALLAVVIFFIGVQLDSGQYRTLCTTSAVCADGQLTPASARVLQALNISLDGYATINIVALLVQALVYYCVAALIVWHKSDEWLAVCVVIGFLAAPTNSLAQPTIASPPIWLAALAFAQYLGVASFLLICYLFPDGRFVPRWMLPIAAISFVVAGIQSFLPNAAWPPVLPGANWVSAFTLLAFSQIYRYRKVSSPEQRQQTKWFVFGLTVAVLLEMVVRLLPLFDPSVVEPGSLDTFVLGTFSAFGFLLIPLTIGFAILRYRLWDIDIIINRALVYGALTASVVGLYVLVVGYLGALLRTEGGGNLGISLVATGLVAVLFQPWRALLQRGANRLLYGQRDEPYAVITRLSQRLESTLALDAVLPTIVETVAQALKLPYAAILWKQEDTLALAASYGRPGAEPMSLPLVYQSETIGQLRLGPRARGEAFSPADMRLLDELARHAGLATHAVRLATDLQKARERLVLAREEERRRLRRDLHDGIGPTLASLAQRIDTAGHLVPRDPEAAVALLIDLNTQVKATIADIRRVVYALRPPVLDELGLVSAIREHALRLEEVSGALIAVEAATDLPPLPAAVEVAAYRIVLEALTNVERHAQARHCLVRIALADERGLLLLIVDDGCGLPSDFEAGVGITSMRERAAELGGSGTITAEPGGGTRVQIRLPLTS
jgi:signal transduction histidine kinase